MPDPTTVAAERWTAAHDWQRASAVVFDTYPPMYDWRCSRCGDTITASRPPQTECRGLDAAH